MTSTDPAASPDRASDASQLWSPPLPPVEPSGLVRPRIGIAGISIESSTFSPHLSGEEAFVLRRGRDLIDWYPFLQADSELRTAADWVPLLHGRALPGGAVDTDFYRSMRDEIVERAGAEGPFDGFYFDIHGAMSVVGMVDAEADLAAALRAALGPDTLVSTSMDLHGNVSLNLLDRVDLITCYRMAPHEDSWNTKERAVHNLLRQLRSAHGSDPVARRPYKAWLQVPVLLPGEKTSTRIEPARSIYARVPEIEAMPEVLDAAVWVGYAWADEPRCQAAVVVTGFDERVVREQASALGRLYWEARADFSFVADARDLDDCIGAAIEGSRSGGEKPFVISDSGDNPTAGGAGDVTWTLARLLERPEFTSGELTVVHASIFDAEAVATAFQAGVGGQVEVTAGATVDSGPSGPVRLVGEVFSLTEGDSEAGRQAVIRCGGVHAILTERRKPFHHLADFTRLGIDPHAVNVLVVKIGYLEPELYELARGWKLGLTPGGVDQDLLRLGHHRLADGVYPFQQDRAEPVLAATVHRR